MILLSFKIFTIQSDFIAQGIALELKPFIVSLFLKFLRLVEILLANNHEILELKR